MYSKFQHNNCWLYLLVLVADFTLAVLQPVAVKQLLNPDRKARSDFLNEIKLLKHVSLDANVVQYLGACFQDDQLWLVTEYMEVESLPLIDCSHRL